MRALAVINPGNPTGQCLSEPNMVDVVRFCEEERLILIADEVYQNNVYGEDAIFTSFRKVRLVCFLPQITTDRQRCWICTQSMPCNVSR